MLTLACTLFPRIIRRLRPVALTFIASALVLVLDNINAIFFLLRNDTAKMVFDEYRIATAQVRTRPLCIGVSVCGAWLCEACGLAGVHGQVARV